MRSMVGLNENLLEWQIVTNESVNPVFVLQHDFLRNIFTKVLHFADRTASKTASGAFGVCITPSHLVSPPHHRTATPTDVFFQFTRHLIDQQPVDKQTGVSVVFDPCDANISLYAHDSLPQGLS